MNAEKKIELIKYFFPNHLDLRRTNDLSYQQAKLFDIIKNNTDSLKNNNTDIRYGIALVDRKHSLEFKCFYFENINIIDEDANLIAVIGFELPYQNLTLKEIHRQINSITEEDFIRIILY